MPSPLMNTLPATVRPSASKQIELQLGVFFPSDPINFSRDHSNG